MFAAALLIAWQAKAGGPVRVGDSAGFMMASLGAPTRTLNAGDGMLYFYPATLIYATNDVVAFVSMAGGPNLPDGTPLTGAPTPHAPIASENHVAPSTPDPHPLRDFEAWEMIAPLSPEMVIECHQRRLTSRARHYAFNKAMAAVTPCFRLSLPLASSGTLMGIKDARGHEFPTFGDSSWNEWYSTGVDMSAGLMAE